MLEVYLCDERFMNSAGSCLIPSRFTPHALRVFPLFVSGYAWLGGWEYFVIQLPFLG